MTTTPRLVEDAARSPLWLDRAGIRMATLWDEQRRLSEAVRIAERWANS